MYDKTSKNIQILPVREVVNMPRNMHHTINYYKWDYHHVHNYAMPSLEINILQIQ